MAARKTKAPTKGQRVSRSGPNIPETQRGARGELIQVRCARGTKARLDALTAERGATRGAIVEMALIAMQYVPEA